MGFCRLKVAKMTNIRIKIRLILGVDKDGVFLTENIIIPSRKLIAKIAKLELFFKKIVALIV